MEVSTFYPGCSIRLTLWKLAAFDICDTSINSRSFRFGLISRRSRYRAGTRYFTRGTDEEGHVANFNETEQVVILEASSIVDQEPATSILSFVQTRGSVPVYWAEVNNLRYKPDLQIMELQDTVTIYCFIGQLGVSLTLWPKGVALQLHFKDQVSEYGSQHIVNLVNQKGYEKPVKDAFERYIAEVRPLT